MLARLQTRTFVLIGAGLVALQVLVLSWLGQPLISASGRVLLWMGDITSAEMSQQLSDWYSFSHIIHGFIFFALLSWLFPRVPIAARVLMAMGIEIGWEILENTPMVIHAYRQQALAKGYVGDSIINSVSDTCMMLLGFFLAWRFPAKYVVALAIAFELLTAYMIHDGLALNILNFIHPFASITAWQSQ